MSQQPQPSTHNQQTQAPLQPSPSLSQKSSTFSPPKSQYLDTVIDCLVQRNTTGVTGKNNNNSNQQKAPNMGRSNSPSKSRLQQSYHQGSNNNTSSEPQENSQIQKLQKLYGQAGNMISQLDTSINRCKKYNEAKINRKYEIIIADLQSEIKKLSDKLKLQQDARSPTKKHISDILDKLVCYRDQNLQLKKQVEEKGKKIEKLQEELQMRTQALQRMETGSPRMTIERLPAIQSGNGSGVSESIRNFLKDREMVRKLAGAKMASSLEKFLSQSKPKIWNWTVPVLLQQLQKWSESIKLHGNGNINLNLNGSKKQVDMWRIRSSIARKFSDYIDDSHNLTKPSKSRSKNSRAISNSLIALNHHNQKAHQGSPVGRGSYKSVSMVDNISTSRDSHYGGGQNDYDEPSSITMRRVSSKYSYEGSKERLNVSMQ